MKKVTQLKAFALQNHSVEFSKFAGHLFSTDHQEKPLPSTILLKCIFLIWLDLMNLIFYHYWAALGGFHSCCFFCSAMKHRHPQGWQCDLCMLSPCVWFRCREHSLCCVCSRVALGSLPTCLAVQGQICWGCPCVPQELAEQEAAGWLPEQNPCRLLRPRVADPGENPQWLDRGREVPAPGNPADRLRYCCSAWLVMLKYLSINGFFYTIIFYLE